mmetsp:Transcript_44917/g.137163  ORF Transcript_44917/g.137163 Transcript_44917/m.137163 type:complete len:126 (-) Transcript_44917:320-697(-)
MFKAAVTEIGEDVLGFSAKGIGTHSNRSAAAMAMYLANVPVYTIMLVGCWSSDPFLLYIGKQVQEFTQGVSQKMVLTEDYYTIPDEAAGAENPRVYGDRNNFSASAQNGARLGRRVEVPSWHLHH